MKRFLAMVLAAVMLLALAACGSMDKDGTYYFVNTAFDLNNESKEVSKKVEQMPWTLDPQQVYANLTYNEKMFYGEYSLPGGDKAVEKFAKTASFAELEYNYELWDHAELNSANLSSLPVRIRAGCASIFTVRGNQEQEWAELYLATENGSYRNVLCTYSVEGNQITFTPLDYFLTVRNEEGVRQGFDYTPGQDGLTYTFSFSGYDLTLSNETGSVVLRADEFARKNSINLGGYLAEGSEALAGIDSFSVTKYDAKDCWTYFKMLDENLMISREAVVFREDGLCRFYWVETDADGNETERNIELVCFPGDGYVSVLTDGKNVYYYTDSYSTREAAILGQMVEEEDKGMLDEMEEEEIKKIAEKKANLLDDLAAAYEEAGLNVSINKKTGEIALDSTILFAVDESAISDEGKAFLQQFMQIYTSVVFSDKYADFVSRIMVEGHTDTSGSYEMNQTLSQARADSVRDYCLSSECGVDAYTAALTEMLQAQGYSYDKPVYDAQGNVDMDASRRVSFRFIINLEG